jgi:molecular chaperone GrpE
MTRATGKSEIEARKLDTEHELPAADEAGDDNAGNQATEALQPARSAGVNESELEKVRAERDTLLDRLARLQAEFENARKRAAREQQEFRDYALVDAVKALLPILDSFDRALQTAPTGKSELRDGVDLIYRQLQDALFKLGLRPIPAKGEPFDPHLHEAVEAVETSSARDHQILEELQRGYKLKDRLLRPSMVKVARNPNH